MIKIRCCECHKEFILTDEEQKWYEAMGFVPPKRCRHCRKQRKNYNNNYNKNNNYDKNNYENNNYERRKD